VIRQVLVPLDGSRLAEAVLPVAAAVAKAFGAQVRLFHVVEHKAPATVHGEQHLTDADQAEAYLAEVARRPVLAGQPVDAHVHRPEAGNVAESVADHAVEFNADVVALSTHGSRGLRDVLFGTIAMQTLKRGDTPILLVPPAGAGAARAFQPHHVLVPLDGSPGHEQALPFAEALARAWKGEVHLEVVVPTANTLSGHQAATKVLLPSATRHVLDLAEQGAEEYVEALAARLKAEGLSVGAHVSRGDPAVCLIQAASDTRADLVVLATHARGVLNAFWSGSLTPKVVAKLDRPMLLVRAAGEELDARPATVQP
jgi:nucleotide-binding universal stress UspA family protein